MCLCRFIQKICVLLVFGIAASYASATHPIPILKNEKSPYVHDKEEPLSVKKQKTLNLLMQAVALYNKYPEWVRAEIQKPDGYFSDIERGGYLVFTTPDGYLHHPKFPEGKAIRVAEITTPHDPGSGARYDQMIRGLKSGEKGSLELGINYNPQTGKPGYIHTMVYKLSDGVTIGSGYYTDKIPQTQHMDPSFVIELLKRPA